MHMKKNIIIFSGYFLPHLGGVEKYTYNMAKELKKRGYNVIIVTSNYNNSNSEDIIDDIKIIKLPILKQFKNRYPILNCFNKEYKKLKKKIFEFKADMIIINTRFYLISALGCNIAKKLNIKSYVIEHGSAYLTLNNKVIDFFIKIYEHFITSIIKRNCSGFIGASEAGNRWLNTFKIKSITTWNNAIVYKNEKFKKSDNPIIISFIGRVIRQKGITIILEAFEKLKEKYENIELHIAGDGDLYKELSEKYKYQEIKFYGHVDSTKVYEILKKSNIVLMPSFHPEGLSYSLLEAGMYETAVIASNLGAFKDVLEDGKDGLLIEPTFDNLYIAIEKLLNNKKLREKLAKNLKSKIIENYTWESTGNKIANFINKELNQ